MIVLLNLNFQYPAGFRSVSVSILFQNSELSGIVSFGFVFGFFVLKSWNKRTWKAVPHPRLRLLKNNPNSPPANHSQVCHVTFTLNRDEPMGEVKSFAKTSSRSPNIIKRFSHKKAHGAALHGTVLETQETPPPPRSREKDSSFDHTNRNPSIFMHFLEQFECFRKEHHPSFCIFLGGKGVLKAARDLPEFSHMSRFAPHIWQWSHHPHCLDRPTRMKAKSQQEEYYWCFWNPEPHEMQ